MKVTNANINQKNIMKKLKIGDCISYKQLCEVLNIPYCAGNQKKAQMAELSRYIETEPTNRKLLILDIYDTPLPPNARAVPSNAIYIKYIEHILLQYLSQLEGNVAYISSQKLWLQLGMVNDKFVRLQDKKDEIIKLNPHINRFGVEDFYKRCKPKLYKILTSSLNSLQRRYLINYEHKYRIGEYFVEDYVGTEAWRRSSYDNTIIFRDATDDETEHIIELTRETLLEFGLEEIQQVYLKNIYKEFYEILNDKFKKKYGWDKVYQCYKIIYNQKNVIQAIPDNELKLQKLMLNNEVIKSVDKQAESIYTKNQLALEDIMTKEKNYEDINFIYPSNYVDMQHILSEELLRIE